MFRPTSNLLLRAIPRAKNVPITRTFVSTTAPRLATGSTDPSSDAKIPSKDELKPVSKESTRSGTNDEIAQDPSAYDPQNTNPAEEKRQVGREVSACESFALRESSGGGGFGGGRNVGMELGWPRQATALELAGGFAGLGRTTGGVDRSTTATAGVEAALFELLSDEAETNGVAMYLGGFWL